VGISKEEFQVFLPTDYVMFVLRAFRELNPETPYQHNWIPRLSPKLWNSAANVSCIVSSLTFRHDL
jgi:hypothetical protein